MRRRGRRVRELVAIVEKFMIYPFY